MDDSQLDEEQRAPSAGPVQQVLFHLVPVSRTQSVDAFSSLPATQLSGAFACSCPLSRSLTDRSRAAVLNLLAEISEYHANNKNKVAAGVPFSNFSKYSLPTTPEADAVSVEVIFVCLFFIQ